MSEHPLELSARMIDSGVVDTPPNRVTQELSELADGVSIVESFSHVVTVDTGDGLVSFDASTAQNGPLVLDSLRGWSKAPIHTLVYTHGHVDHVGGSRAFAADAKEHGFPVPRVVGHENVATRFDRYEYTKGYNRAINMRQFGAAAKATMGGDRPFLPTGTLRPDVDYAVSMRETIGGVDFEYFHCKGETDDHTWTWVPQHKLISAGDQFIWNFPNCGNPQKVQRYPIEWAESLRAMAAMDAELFVPAHGLPIAGKDRIRGVLEIVAETLEVLVAQVVEAMNTGATLDDIVHSVSVPAETLNLPYLRPLYDEPEFVIRNIWRLFGGWYDGNPARLKPASDAAIGAEVAALAGGAQALVNRALELSAAGDHRLACQIIEYAVAAEPESHAVHEARAAVYVARRSTETSLMAKGIYGSAAADSTTVVTGEAPETKMILTIGEA
ncbi:MAG: alkyl sulfatase dimerization domain-containing protein [Acidimicrobiales bacterium]